MTPGARFTIGPLFGEIALNLGMVRASDVLDALCEQEEQRNRGEVPERIGQILVNRGRIGKDDVTKVMREVERRAWAIEVPGYHSLEHVSRDETTLRFHAVAMGTRRPVTIKILRFSLADSPEDLDRFRRETKGLARLQHPNVLRLLHSGDLEGIPYLVLEHVHGPDLRRRVEEGGPLREPEVLDLAAGIAAGLEHAHALGVLHASLRPDSVLLPRIGGPKVTDFTLFEWNPDDSASKASRIRSPHYLSPEQARGTGWPTLRSDVYSLGATLFFVVTGRPPFRGPYREILKQHLRRPPPDPRVHSPGLSAGLSDLLVRMLAKDPADRPADMAEVFAEVASLARVEGPAVAAAAPEKDPNRAPSRLWSRRGSR